MCLPLPAVVVLAAAVGHSFISVLVFSSVIFFFRPLLCSCESWLRFRVEDAIYIGSLLGVLVCFGFEGFPPICAYLCPISAAVAVLAAGMSFIRLLFCDNAMNGRIIANPSPCGFESHSFDRISGFVSSTIAFRFVFHSVLRSTCNSRTFVPNHINVVAGCNIAALVMVCLSCVRLFGPLLILRST